MSAERMKPWPSLAGYRRELELPQIRTKLFLYDSGSAQSSATPIILIHGLGDEADSWRHLFAPLAAERRVLAPDLPGFGRSVCRRGANLATHVQAILALLAETGPAVLVGSSLGAAVAELTAQARPDLARGLALIDGGLPGAGGLSPSVVASLLPFVGKRGYRAYRHDHDAAFASLAPYYADVTALPNADRDFLRARVIDRVESDAQMNAYYASFRSYVATAVGRGAAIGRRLRNAGDRLPLLILWGDADRILPIATVDVLRGLRPDAAAFTVAGAGHLPHQERPEETVRVLKEFLSGLEN